MVVFVTKEQIHISSKEGYKIWHIIKEKYMYNPDDLILFYEINNTYLVEELNGVLEKAGYDHIYVITYIDDCKIASTSTIKLPYEQYMDLRLFFLLTVCRPRVRFISDEEPFGNISLYKLDIVNKKDYIRRCLLKRL